jgi:hypothetical protein
MSRCRAWSNKTGTSNLNTKPDILNLIAISKLLILPIRPCFPSLRTQKLILPILHLAPRQISLPILHPIIHVQNNRDHRTPGLCTHHSELCRSVVWRIASLESLRADNIAHRERPGDYSCGEGALCCAAEIGCCPLWSGCVSDVALLRGV